MSSFFVVGFMAVKGGSKRDVESKSQSGDSIRLQYVFYNVGIQCLHTRSPILGELRSYCYSPTEAVLKDNTVIFVVAKAHAPPNSVVLLECLYMAPIPGDPDEESYDDNIPDTQYPFIFCLGQVTRSTEPTATSTLKTFQMNVSEFVRGKKLTSVLQ